MSNQNLAIAYAIKRRQQKKMGKGGEVENEKLHPENEPKSNGMLKEMYGPEEVARAILKKKQKLADGGMVEDEGDSYDDELHGHGAPLAVDDLDDGMEQLLASEHDHDSLDSEPEEDKFDHIDPKEKQRAMLRAIMSKARGRA